MDDIRQRSYMSFENVRHSHLTGALVSLRLRFFTGSENIDFVKSKIERMKKRKKRKYMHTIDV